MSRETFASCIAAANAAEERAMALEARYADRRDMDAELEIQRAWSLATWWRQRAARFPR